MTHPNKLFIGSQMFFFNLKTETRQNVFLIAHHLFNLASHNEGIRMDHQKNLERQLIIGTEAWKTRANGA